MKTIRAAKPALKTSRSRSTADCPKPLCRFGDSACRTGKRLSTPPIPPRSAWRFVLRFLGGAPPTCAPSNDGRRPSEPLLEFEERGGGGGSLEATFPLVAGRIGLVHVHELWNPECPRRELSRRLAASGVFVLPRARTVDALSWGAVRGALSLRRLIPPSGSAPSRPASPGGGDSAKGERLRRRDRSSDR